MACNPQLELQYMRQARSDLPMSHVDRMQDGQAASNRKQVEIVRQTNKNQTQLTTNLLPLGINVIHKTLPSKLWFSGIVITWSLT